MKMLPNSQATFWQEMELPSMSSRAAFRAKISAWQDAKPESVKAPAADSGPKSSDLLASYHRATSSWRTSQHCFLGQVNSRAHGLAEYSQTWPSAGMMRNGKTYQHRPWALPIAASVSGLLPTPNARDGKDLSRTTAFLAARSRHSPSLSTEALLAGVAWQNVASLYEIAMGFPVLWTDAE